MRASPAKGNAVPARASPGAPRAATALRPSRRRAAPRRRAALGSPRVRPPLSQASDRAPRELLGREARASPPWMFPQVVCAPGTQREGGRRPAGYVSEAPSSSATTRGAARAPHAGARVLPGAGLGQPHRLCAPPARGAASPPSSSSLRQEPAGKRMALCPPLGELRDVYTRVGWVREAAAGLKVPCPQRLTWAGAEGGFARQYHPCGLPPASRWG